MFDFNWEDPEQYSFWATGKQSLQLRLISYNPDNHSVSMRPVDEKIEGSITWDTDWFWALLRNGRLLRN